MLAPAVMAAAGLANGKIAAEFGDRGLVSLHDTESGATFHFSKDEFAVRLDGKDYDAASLGKPVRKEDERRVGFSYTAGPYRIDVIYELRPEWRFLSKEIWIASSTGDKFRVNEITVFRDAFSETVRDAYAITRKMGDYGGCLRFDQRRGLLVTVQNPFLKFEREGEAFTCRYKPEMEWKAAVGRSRRT